MHNQTFRTLHSALTLTLRHSVAPPLSLRAGGSYRLRQLSVEILIEWQNEHKG